MSEKKYRKGKAAICLLLCLSLMFSCASAAKITEYEYIDGIKCKKKQNILTYLFMGIDEYYDTKETLGEDYIPGQCDVLMLLVIDKAADTYAVINIDRNTMASVHAISDYDDSDLGTYPMQIALAHTNGDGERQSCEVVSRAVSDLFLGVRVDKYASVTMDAIRQINASVGGVSVYIEDDFSNVDPSLECGQTIHLTDEQAETYIRARSGMEIGTNEARMKRQKQYVEAFRPLFMEKYRQDINYPLDLVHSMSDYMVTDMTDKDFSYIAKAANKNTYLGDYRLTGYTQLDDNGWEAFYPDEESIVDTVLELFYTRLD